MHLLIKTLCMVLTGTIVFSSFALAQTGKMPQPRSIEYEIAVQRAAQAAIWGMPAVGIRDIVVGTRRDLGGDIGDIIYFSKPMESRHGFLTANDVTPYVVASLSTQDGPIVVEVPPAGEKANYFGTFVDAWDVPIVDVGPPGADKGKGGKYLFLPPGHEGNVPEGYMVYRPATYSVNFAFRPVSKNGGTLEEAVAYGQTLKTYKLSEAANPPKTRFIDAYPKTWNTLPTYDITYFQDLAAAILNEPVQERDKAMMGLLASLGIEKGKPFEPDAEMTAIIKEGLALAYDAMQHYFVTPGKAMVPYWPGSQWQVWNFAKGQAEAGFPFVTDDRILIDERAGGAYFWITYLPKSLGGGTFYLTALRDKDGDLFDRNVSYRLRVPADTPAKDFWSVIVYSMKTKGFVEGVDRVGLSSKDLDRMRINEDDSMNLYFGSKAPAGLESNWVPTGGEDFFLMFRLYGPDKPLFDKSWVLGDVEKVR